MCVVHGIREKILWDFSIAFWDISEDDKSD